MILKEIQLKNFRQHRELSVTFSPRLNMLVGRNGAGKTNLLNAIQLALTGETSGPAKKNENISQWVDKSSRERSSVYLTLEHAATLYKIFRGLKPSANELVFAGHEGAITGFAEVNNELWTRLGTTQKQLADYVFVRQRQIDAIIEKPPTERSEELSTLFGLDHAKRIARMISEFMRDVEIPAVTIDIDTQRQLLQSQYSQLEELSRQLQLFGHVVDDLTKYAKPRRDIIAAYQRASTLQSDLRIYEAKLAELQAQRAKAAAVTAELQKACDEYGAADRAQTAAYEAHMQQWREWEQYDKFCSQVNALDATRAMLIADVKQRPRWVAPIADPITEAVFLATVQPLEAALTTRQAAQRQLQSRTGTCHACGQLLPDAEACRARVAQLQKEIASISEQLEPLRERRARTAAYETARATWLAGLADRKAAIAQYRQQAKTMPVVKAPVVPREQVHAKLAALAAEVNDIRSKQPAAAAALRENLRVIATCDGGIATTDTNAKRCRQELQTLQHATQAAAMTAENEIALMNSDSQARGALRAQYQGLRAAYDAGTRTLGDNLRIQTLAAGTRHAVEKLELTRAIFHPNAAPGLVSRAYLREMQDRINDILGIFEAPFTVALDDSDASSLAFNGVWLDGSRVIPDRLLSVGERIVLAMAFRIVLNSTFASSLSLLVLDEPTAGLDEHNLGCLPRALERLRDLSTARGLQVLFVTHEPRIANYFDNVIRLGT